jgi:aminopeptidase N
VFENEQLDNATQSRRTASGWKSTATYNPDYYPVPLDHPSLIDFSGVAYGPGPLTLFRHFEGLYDRDTVFVALADLLGQPRAVGVADLKDAMERATGADLDAYFDRWVYGEGAPNWPHFTVTLDDLGGGDVTVHVAQDDPEDGLYGCAFSLWLQNTDTDQQLEVWIDLGLEGLAEKTVTAHPGFAVTRTLFDPETYCLANVPQLAGRSAAPRPWRAPTQPLPYRP